MCGLCQNSPNEYFCEICNKNICKNCHNYCNEERHKIQSLEKFKDKFKEIVSKIRNILSSIIIPLKENENVIYENNLDIMKESDDNIDIFLI